MTSPNVCERLGVIVPSKIQFVSLLHLHSPWGELRGRQFFVVLEQFTAAEIVEDTVFAERKPAESDNDGDKLV